MKIQETLRQHMNAKYAHEIIFTKGNTEAINLIANGFKSILKKGDEVLVSTLEHHSNIVPWQMLCEQTASVLKVIPMNNNGTLDMDSYQDLLSEKTKVVAVNHISNALRNYKPH